MGTNAHGLRRSIPEETKRSVRARCGFGCAICGVTITEYEHFLPDYADAKIHDSEKIVLLCPTHHSMVTKGLIPKEQVQDISNDPIAKRRGFSSAGHPWFRGIPALKFGGGSLISGTPIPLQIKGLNIIEFNEPEDGSNVTRISAMLKSASGEQFLSVENNEWHVHTGSWDFESRGPRYIFKDVAGSVMLQLRMEPPTLIAVEILKTSISGIPIDINEDRMMIGSSKLTGGVFSNCRVGMSFG